MKEHGKGGKEDCFGDSTMRVGQMNGAFKIIKAIGRGENGKDSVDEERE